MKFFLDNNLPPALALALDALSVPYGHSVSHLQQLYKANTPDSQWISDLATNGEWVVITHDNLNKGLEREALRQAGLIVFFLDSSWASHSFWDKAYQLVRWWPRVIEQSSGITGGAAFKVKWNFSGKGKFEQIKI